MGGADEGGDLTPGMFISLVVDENNVVHKMNCCEKVELENSIPFEVADSDLEDELYVEGYVNGDDSELVRFAVDHDATVIESDGTEIRIAPQMYNSSQLNYGNVCLPILLVR